jgi:hypothetical protein
MINDHIELMARIIQGYKKLCIKDVILLNKSDVI